MLSAWLPCSPSFASSTRSQELLGGVGRGVGGVRGPVQEERPPPLWHYDLGRVAVVLALEPHDEVDGLVAKLPREVGLARLQVDGKLLVVPARMTM